MSASESNTVGSCQKEGNDAPPHLSIELPKLSDLAIKSEPWRDDQLPVDILLLSVKECEFLACYAYVKNNSVKRYHIDLGYVYFGSIGNDNAKPLKVALLQCLTDALAPGGSQTVVKNAVMKLRPKAIFSVGCCKGLKPEKTQLRDVVVSLKLTTEDFKTPVGRNITYLINSIAHGWNPPIKGPDACQVRVHYDGEILSGIDNPTLYPTAIALDMEGKGIFAAAHDLKMEWVIIKGISHFADSDKTPDGSCKSHACVMAASLVFKLLNDTAVFEQWPHYKDEDSREMENSASQRERVLSSASSPDAKRTKNSDEDSREMENSASQRKRVLSSASSPDAKRTKNLDDFPLKKCQEQLKSKYNDMSDVTTIPWDRTVVHINTIYTQLSWLKDDVKPRGVMKTKLEDYPDIFTSKGQRNPKRILVYGRPGIGKSTFCKKAAYDWSQNSKQILSKFDLVLLIKLRDVCNLRDVSAILTASELLASDSNISIDSLYRYITDHQDKVLLILDGFDEYSCEMKESPVCRIWDRKMLSECTVVLTMRPIDELKRSLCFEINGFDSEDQVKVFSQKFLVDESVVNEFYEFLESQDLKEIAEIPLLLSMLCVLWREKVLRSDSTSRANIYTSFIKIMRGHLSEKEDRKPFEITEEELSKLGKLAYNALLNGNLILWKSELTGDLQIVINKLIKVGLCHAFKPSPVDPQEGTSFIHKSFQEYIAGVYLKELAFSRNDEKATFLSELDSIEKILKMREVLKFASELSGCSACAILNHVGNEAMDEGLTAYLEELAAMETPSLFRERQEVLDFLMLMVDIFCCSAETKQNLFPAVLSYVGSVLLINSDQLHSIANQHLLKSTELPNLIFFPWNPSRHPKRDYCDLISVLEDLNAVVVSVSLEVKNASQFLKKYPARPIGQFFLKKEEKMHLYFAMITDGDFYGISHAQSFPFPTEMLKELIASPESTAQQSKKSDAHQSSEQNTRTAVCSTRDTDTPFFSTHHSLSLVWEFSVFDSLNASETQVLAEVIPLAIAPERISLVRQCSKLIGSSNFTDRLLSLDIEDPPDTIFRSLHKCPHLCDLDVFGGPVGEGVSVMISHLNSVPLLRSLGLHRVIMTKQQVHDLTTAVRQSKISKLESPYHDSKGDPLPEDEWPSEEYWKARPWLVPSESEDRPG